MMRYRVLAVLMAVLLSTVAFAQDDMADDVSQWELSGFVDASWTANLNQTSHTFSFDQAELDVTRSMGEELLLRADFQSNGQGIGTMEQGFMMWRPAQVDGLGITFGKFNAPMGFEAVDAPDMYQYSHSLLFDYALPTNLTGAKFDYGINEQMGIAAWVVNGWDQNTDTNEAKTYGFRFDYGMDALAFGLSGIMGPADVDQNFSPVVIDADVSFTGVENLLVGAEVNYGMVMLDPDNTADSPTWLGIMVMGNYSLNEWFAITGRYDMLMDNDLYISTMNPAFINSAGLAATVSDVTRSSITVAPLFTLGNGMGALIEYRMDMASEDVYQDGDGNATGTLSTVAFEMTYTF